MNPDHSCNCRVPFPCQFESKMPPNSSSTITTTTICTEEKRPVSEDIGATYFGIRFRTKVVWRNVSIFFVIHLIGLYGIYLILTSQSKIETTVFTLVLHMLSGVLGITGGAHRLWTHRSFKAKAPLRFIMMMFNNICLQNHIYEWTRDHRVHHKYSDTDADPHNTNRGFFFSHIGWLMMKKHPSVIEKGKKLDISDLEEDAIVMFQKKYYFILAPLFAYILPTLIPYMLWQEDFITSYVVAAVLRHLITLHSTWSVNSVAHMFGNKPYDMNIEPSENSFVSMLTFGEGYHNYHHTFPFDYSTSEFKYGLNMTTRLIDFFAFIGQVSDRKTCKKETVHSRRTRTGDLNGRSLSENIVKKGN